ncbi:MAG: AsmA family protein, partial [Proteobacteria bacterium]
MKRVLKFLAAASALVFLAAVAAIVWLTVFFDADVYRDEIEEAVRRHTGREIDIEGPLAVKVFPRIVVEAGRMTLAARDGFGPDPMVEMEGAAVFLQARPLLRGKIEIDRIRFDSPRVRLAVNDVGESAWGDLAARLQHAAGGGAPIGDEQFLGVGLAALAVQGLVVDDGELQWSDAFRGTYFIAADIDLEMERLRHREAGGLSLKARIVDEARGASLDIAVTAMVRADFETLDTDITMLEVEIAGSAFHARATAKSVDLRGLRAAPEFIAGDVVVAASRGDTSVELSAPLLRYRRSGNTLAADV